MNSDQDKPQEWTVFEMASGEWCVEFDDANGATCINELNAKAIANAHNASLAAEREKVYDAVSHEKAVVISEVIKLRSELAAEREQVQTLVDALKEINEAIPRAAKLPLVVEIKEIAQAALDADKQLRKGSSLEASHQTFNELVHDNQQLREQLAAEREQVATLVDALKEIRQNKDVTVGVLAIADAALAKVGK